MGFPKDFAWGAAAASYQVEGAAYEDGKGLSVWDVMCRQAGRVADGNTGDVACDHYRRYADDVRLMREIGLKAYRLSISWPRVLPDGVGKVNGKGLAFYDRLIDALLAENIQPWVTLFHWDYPFALYCRGGWLNRDSADWFAEYAHTVADKLSDRVTHWMTHNEPQCFIGLGHQSGDHAPGLKLALSELLLAWHHCLLAHGRGVQAIRAAAKRKVMVGAAPVGNVKIPATEKPEDVDAARRAMFGVRNRDFWNNTWFADPAIFGRYPEDGAQLFGKDMPRIGPGDMETIRQPLDFFGVNIYSGDVVRSGGDGECVAVKAPDGPPLTAMQWLVRPESLYWGPKFLHERYGLPIVITENGMAGCDWIHCDGKVHDPQRIDFHARYLTEYRRAIDYGVDARGYFLWSVLDNFEWAFGYKRRFGIVHVDFATGRRIPKDSAYWYRDVISSNGSALALPARQRDF